MGLWNTITLSILIVLSLGQIQANELCSNEIDCQFNQSESSLQCFSSSGLVDAASLSCVASINMTGAGMVAPLDDILQTGITHVNDLILRGNSFTAVPNFLQTLTVYKSLDISFNQISKITNSTLTFLSGIQMLDFSHNEISEIENGSFRDMHQLEFLDLSDNSISNLPSGLLSNCNRLRTLILSNNVITDISSDTWNGLQLSLTEVYLSNNRLSNIPSATFQNLQDLRTLALNSNPGLQSVNLDFPPHLSDIQLQSCSINEINECRFSQLIDLTSLDLTENDLSCDCHVTWLYDKYLQIRQMNSKEELAQSTQPWGCTINTTASSNCLDHQSYPSHCEKTAKSDTDLLLSNKLEVEINMEDFLDVYWTYNTTSSQDIYGFQTFLESDDSDVGRLYQTAILHKDVRHVTIKLELDSGTYQVCVKALLNDSYYQEEQCQELSVSDLKIVIGILAGVIFIVPCIVGLAFIIYKDRQVTAAVYHSLTGQEQEIKKHEKPQIQLGEEATSNTNTMLKTNNTSHINESFIPDHQASVTVQIQDETKSAQEQGQRSQEQGQRAQEQGQRSNSATEVRLPKPLELNVDQALAAQIHSMKAVAEEQDDIQTENKFISIKL